MATYKVLQDIEAEDTLVGPLTLRQCIYAAIALVCMYLSYLVIAKGAPALVIVFLPFIAMGVFFAFPWSKQQPTEVWALAKVRFALKPRKRIWNQSGVREQVTITAPKVPLNRQVRSLTQNEVENRLKALADTIDSRGWATKNIELGYYAQPSIMGDRASDRLIDPSGLPQDVPSIDPDAAADIFDTRNNPVAQKLDMMMTQSAGVHHQQLVQQMSQPQAPTPAEQYGQDAPVTNLWHMKTIQPPTIQSPSPVDPPTVSQVRSQSQWQQTAVPSAATFTDPASQVISSNPSPTQTYQAVQAAAPVQPQYYAGTDFTAGVGAGQQPMLNSVQPPVVSPPAPDYSAMRLPTSQAGSVNYAIPPAAPQSYNPPLQNVGQSVTTTPNPAILELANNNDLDVATIAREAQARSAEAHDEVVISLH